MGLIDWRILAFVAAMGLVALAVGVRGRRVDGRPRCKRGRCRYELTSFLGDSRPGGGYPATCPECGCVANSEREVKWGKRRARRWMMIVGAALLAVAATPVGIEIHARATSGNPLALSPLWVITNRAEHDTLANNFVHQRELFRRAETKAITGRSASRLVDRILRMQKDEAIAWGVLGDVFASLAAQGEATDEDVKEFWAHIIIPRVHVRDVVEVGRPIAWSVEVAWRGHQSRHLMQFFHQQQELVLPTQPGSTLPDWDRMSLLESKLAVSINGEAVVFGPHVISPIRPAMRDWESGATEYFPKISHGFGPNPQQHFIARADVPVMIISIKGALGLLYAPQADQVRRLDMLPAPVRTVIENEMKWEWEFQANASVNVVEQGAIPSDPALDAFVQSAPQFTAYLGRSQGPQGQALRISLHSGASPGEFAARVFLRRGSEEQYIGSTVIPARPYRWLQRPMDGVAWVPALLDDWFLPDAPRVEVVLRCDDAAVRSSPRLHRWESEIVIPITDTRNMQIPGQAPPTP